MWYFSRWCRFPNLPLQSKWARSFSKSCSRVLSFSACNSIEIFHRRCEWEYGFKKKKKNTKKHKKARKTKQNTWKKQNTTTEYLSTSICIYLFRCKDWDRTQILGAPKHQNLVFHQKQWINEYQKQDKHRTLFSCPHPLTIPRIACGRGKHFCR